MRTLQASTSYGVSIPSFVAPSHLRLRHCHVILAKAEHSEKSVEIMRKFSEKSGTYFCVDKGVTPVVIKVITRINYGQSISISGLAGMSMVSYYELKSTKGNSYTCDFTEVATPLDELNISFTPAISIPIRKLQHTHATFVRGFLKPVNILTITSIIQNSSCVALILVCFVALLFH